MSLPSEAESGHPDPEEREVSTEIVDEPFRLEGGSVGAGFGVFVGLPVGLAGMVLIGSSWPYVSFYLDGPVGELSKYLAGCVLMVLGVFAAMGGEVWYFDSRSRTFVRTWRLLRWPLRKRVMEFDSVVSVRCTRQIVGNDAHEAFAIEIGLPDGKSYRLASRAQLQEALAMTARLCQILDLPFGGLRSEKS